MSRHIIYVCVIFISVSQCCFFTLLIFTFSQLHCNLSQQYCVHQVTLQTKQKCLSFINLVFKPGVTSFLFMQLAATSIQSDLQCIQNSFQLNIFIWYSSFRCEGCGAVFHAECRMRAQPCPRCVRRELHKKPASFWRRHAPHDSPDDEVLGYFEMDTWDGSRRALHLSVGANNTDKVQLCVCLYPWRTRLCGILVEVLSDRDTAMFLFFTFSLTWERWTQRQ